jgi:hypothetical protein
VTITPSPRAYQKYHNSVSVAPADRNPREVGTTLMLQLAIREEIRCTVPMDVAVGGDDFDTAGLQAEGHIAVPHVLTCAIAASPSSRREVGCTGRRSIRVGIG